MKLYDKEFLKWLWKLMMFKKTYDIYPRWHDSFMGVTIWFMLMVLTLIFTLIYF